MSLPGMKQLAPGIYDDGCGGMHVVVEEGLAYQGLPVTPENADRFIAMVRDVAAEHGIPFLEVEQ